MNLSCSHPWDVTPHEAIEIQKKLSEYLILQWANPTIRRVGGIDVSYSQEKVNDNGYAVVVVMGWPDLDEIDMAWTKAKVSFPYIPGLLAFREAPLVMQAWDRLRYHPDLIYVDGQGIAHPRSFGIASHLGMLLDIPAIGCAKNSLIGEEPIVGDTHGDNAPLLYQGQAVGMALRMRTRVKPLYVSPGHLIDLTTAMQWVLLAYRGYRLPEPLRRAHIRANQVKSTYQ